MAELLLDEQGRPIPQYLNSAGTSYEEWKGDKGAGRVLLWGIDGSALLTSANPGNVKVVESALPTGAATAALQTTISDKVATVTSVGQVKSAVDLVNISVGLVEEALREILRIGIVSQYPIGAEPWSLFNTSGSGPGVTLTKSAEVDKTHFVCGILAVLLECQDGEESTILIRDDAISIWSDTIRVCEYIRSRTDMLFMPALPGTSGNAISLNASAPAAGKVKLSMYGYTL
jgi:hypothetical protein